LLTFYNLVEAFVLATMRRDANVELPVVRASVELVRDKLKVSRPLLMEDFYTDGVSLLVDSGVSVVDASRQGQLAMREVVAASLQRIDRDEHGLAARLYPWRQSVDEDRVIELEPRRALGSWRVRASPSTWLAAWSQVVWATWTRQRARKAMGVPTSGSFHGRWLRGTGR